MQGGWRSRSARRARAPDRADDGDQGRTGGPGARREHAAYPLDYAFRVDGGEPRPDPRSAWQPHGVHGAEPHLRRRRAPVAGRHLGRSAAGPGHAGRRACYELHVGTFTPEGTLDARCGRPRPPRRARRRRRRAHAGRGLRRTLELGLRRRRPVCRARRLRRPGRPAALRRRLPPARAGRLPRRRLQPPGPVRELPVDLRPVLHRRRTTRPGGRRSTSTGRAARGAPVDHRQRAAVVRATSTSTRCGSTPCTRCATTRQRHVLAELSDEVGALVGARSAGR